MKLNAGLMATIAAAGFLLFHSSSQGQQAAPTSSQEPRKFGPLVRTPMTMESLDGDRNGEVTLEEFIEAHIKTITQRFEIIDKNGDNLISEDELAVAEQRMRQGGPGQGGPGHAGPGQGGFGPMRERPPFQDPFEEQEE